MKKVAIILILFVALLVIIPMSSYNGLVQSRETISEKEATIDVQLKRRTDLIGNLVESVKGYAAHETEIINSVSEARTHLAGAKTTDEKASANEEVSGALSRLIAISENYPELKADANFRQLSDELAGTENRISVARMDYNAAVATYNKKIVSFPSNIMANLMGLEKAIYFEAAERDTEVPQINFGR